MATYIRLPQVACGFISPAGKRLGKIPAPEGIRFANLAFGDPDGKTL
jgi:sugar lactone lactonase YvrE